MGYRQPKRKLTDRDPPDPRLFREAIAGAAQEFAGRLNEHNVVENDLVATTRFAPSFLYDFHYESVSVDGGIDTNATNNDYPDSADPNAFKIEDSGGWQAVSDITVTYTTGDHVAWCLAGFYYGIQYKSVFGFTLGDSARDKARIQFAIRVNGTVMDETITGTERPDDPATRPTRPIQPIVPSPDTMKSIDYQSLRGAGAMSWPVRAMRVQCNIRLPSGAATVELVARRVINDDPPLSVAGAASPDVYVYNRRLLVVEQKLGGNDAQDAAPVSVTYPVDGDALNAANTNTSQLQPIVTAANDLPADAILRGGLRREHMTRTQTRQLKESRITTGATTVRQYPGWGNLGVVGAGDWSLVDDGAGTSLRVKLNDGSGFWNFTDNPAFMLILGNVSLLRVNHIVLTPSSGMDRLPCHYAVLGAGLTYSGGATSLDPPDQVWTNNGNAYHSSDPAADESYWSINRCDTDMPILSYYDFRSAPPAGGPVDYVRLLISAWNAGSIEWNRGSLFVILFYP